MKRITRPATAVGFIAAAVLLGSYLGLHLWSLSWFPFIHSDEAWLASLSRTMWTDGVAAGEEFFYLTPRYPHALKTLYHLIQGALVTHWWYPAAARLPSLVAGVASMVLLGLVVGRITGRRVPAYLVASAAALDPQFFYISHLARQEALILACTMAAVYLCLRISPERWRPRAVAVAFIIGVAIFIHPNAYIACCVVAPWIVVTAPRHRRGASMLLFCGVLAAAATFAIGLSIRMDPDFLYNYRRFGESVGVTTNVFQRAQLLREFFIKATRQIAGTYYLPPMRAQLWGAVFLGFIVVVVKIKQVFFSTDPSRRSPFLLVPLVSTLTAVSGIFIIGKYSPPSIVFILPGLYITLGVLAQYVKHRAAIVALFLIPLAGGVQLAGELYQMYPHRGDGGRIAYSEYVGRIRSHVPRGEVALANLNTAFAFDPGELRVWRDLDRLPASVHPECRDGVQPVGDRPVARFLKEHDVRWIILPAEELAKIYRERPVWNNVYGNPTRFYPDIIKLLKRYGTLMERFEADPYAMRLVPFLDHGPHHVEIYRLDLP